MCTAVTNCISSGFSKCMSCFPLAGRCHNIGWRDYLMASGLVFTITGLVISLLEAATLYAGLFAIGTVALFLGTYLINRVKELETMERQLLDFKSKIVHLEKINTDLSRSAANFKKQLADQKAENATYAKENQKYKQLNTELAVTVEECQKFKDDIKRLPEAFAPLAKEFTETTEELAKVKTQFAALKETEERDHLALNAKLQATTDNLNKTREMINITLQNGAERLSALFDCLQTVAASLQTSAQKVEQSIPAYALLAERVRSTLNEARAFQLPLLPQAIPV